MSIFIVSAIAWATEPANGPTIRAQTRSPSQVQVQVWAKDLAARASEFEVAVTDSGGQVLARRSLASAEVPNGGGSIVLVLDVSAEAVPFGVELVEAGTSQRIAFTPTGIGETNPARAIGLMEGDSLQQMTREEFIQNTPDYHALPEAIDVRDLPNHAAREAAINAALLQSENEVAEAAASQLKVLEVLEGQRDVAELSQAETRLFEELQQSLNALTPADTPHPTTGVIFFPVTRRARAA